MTLGQELPGIKALSARFALASVACFTFSEKSLLGSQHISPAETGQQNRALSGRSSHQAGLIGSST